MSRPVTDSRTSVGRFRHVRSVASEWFPSEYQRAPYAWVTLIALFGLVLFAISEFLNADLSRKGEWLMLLATLIALPTIWRKEPSRWLYCLLAAFLVYMFALNAVANHYWTAEMDHAAYARDYLRIFWFVLAGWWLGGQERGALTILAIAAGSFIVAVAWHGGLAPWAALFDGSRVDFGLRNAQHTAILAGTMLLGLATLGLRLPVLAPARLVPVCWVLWAGTLAFAVLVFLGTQARQVWLGLAAAATVIMLFALTQHRDVLASAWRRFRLLAALALIAVIGLGIVTNPFSSMGAKMAREAQAVRALMEHGPEGEVPLTSASIRLLQWHLAIEKIAERPWLGYGGAAKAEILRRSDLPRYIRENFGHLHNSYLELWVGYGVVAPAVFITLLLTLVIKVLRAFKARQLSGDFAVFALAWLAFFAVVNIFESYVTYRSGTFLLMLVGGAIYSLSNNWRVQNTDLQSQ